MSSSDNAVTAGRRYIGLLPPDPTAAPLPAELPKREGVKVMLLHAYLSLAEDVVGMSRVRHPTCHSLLPKLHAHCQQVLDLNAMSAEEIAAAARATATADPFAAKLPEPPGVRCSRQAFITGPPT